MKGKVCYSCVALALLLCAVTPPTNGGYYSRTVIQKPRPLKKTTLHFYLHDILSGNDPGAVLVAHPNITLGQKSATPFGSVYAIDDPITEGPEPNSKVIGNAQGLYVSSAKDVLSLVMYVDFEFTAGEFNGSSISVFSRNPVTQAINRELAVVGGRKKLRMAKGFALLKTHSLEPKSGDAVIEYHVTVYHH